MTGILSDAANVDAGQPERGRPALFDRRFEDDCRARRNREPGVAAELGFELAAAPTGVAERYEHRLGPVPRPSAARTSGEDVSLMSGLATSVAS